jgi:simple sugar transport system ATP-binding protein
VSARQERAVAARVFADWHVVPAAPDVTFARLSGGNQQKVVLAREIGREPRVLLAVQPTRGLDVGAIEFVHEQLVAARDAGLAVLLVSLELDEVIALSDRILVIYEGRIVAEYGSDATPEELGIAMTGGRVDEETAA